MRVGSRKEWEGRSGGAESRTASAGAITPDPLLQSEIDEQVLVMHVCVWKFQWERQATWLTSTARGMCLMTFGPLGIMQAARQREMLAAKREENIRR